jgi:hypothetical protein
MQADPDDAVMLLIDHQSGLFQTVKDMEVTVPRANVVNPCEGRHSRQNTCDHHSICAARTEWSAHS